MNVQNNGSTTEYDIFGTIYTYTIRAKIHFGGLLEIAPNSFDYHDLRDKNVKLCLSLP